MRWEQTFSEPPSLTAVLQAQGNVEDHEDAGRTTSKTYQWLQDRTAWRANVSLALAFDPQEWERTSPFRWPMVQWWTYWRRGGLTDLDVAVSTIIRPVQAVLKCDTIRNSKLPQGRRSWGVWGSWTNWKYVGGVRICFDPQNVIFFTQNCCWISFTSSRMKHLC